MNVLIISECSKDALDETRRIVDQFAERKGQRTWQTSITEQGLLTLRRMLRQTARKNTAVACHWIKSGNRTELLWVVGNAQRFSYTGVVPTNITESDILRSKDENSWSAIEDIVILSGLAGLFHDFGKANNRFQKKLKGVIDSPEPYRHEWVSLKIFAAFIQATQAQSDDKIWLEYLQKIDQGLIDATLSHLAKDGCNPFSAMPPLAQTVGYLILTHHRLPRQYNSKVKANLEGSAHWFTQDLDAKWNDPDSGNQSNDEVWEFDLGLPFSSDKWKENASNLASRALKRKSLLGVDWLGRKFTLHMARMTLMLADHYYSGRATNLDWIDKKLKIYANTKNGNLNQRLDEHLIGVGRNAQSISKLLPKIKQLLPSLKRQKNLKKRSNDAKYRWQDKSYDLATSLQVKSDAQGFFGINLASTGLGKTFANAKIIYGLSDATRGCRFSVALGLRTLTLQTGDALRERLKLDEDDLAVLIGSQAVKELHELQNISLSSVPTAMVGSESIEDILGEEIQVRYDGAMGDGPIKRWLKDNPRLDKLLSAPILACTIDHLMPATEGWKGGRQIAPMLRLLTSDLILDEPDDFDLKDLPALCRLVNWAGMLGSKVLLSSATLPPSVVEALFESYAAGRQAYAEGVDTEGSSIGICCAWFDEFGVKSSDHSAGASFATTHTEFVKKRAQNLENELLVDGPKRRGELISLPKSDPLLNLPNLLVEKMCSLHDQHNEACPLTGKKFSVGLVRFANINPMIGVAKKLLSISAKENYRVHYCVYHAQFPLAIRSFIERELDSLLKRHNVSDFWNQLAVKNITEKYSEENQLLIVLATPVAEVGRDHDYDWAIVEPSSMRSIIQLSGRVRRHRDKPVNESPNVSILRTNIKTLKKGSKAVTFNFPGFESNEFKLNSKDLKKILNPNQYQQITSIERIMEPSSLDPQNNLVALEHAHLRHQMEDAAKWWNFPLHWSSEYQQRTPFRQSVPDESFFIEESSNGKLNFFYWNDRTKEKKSCKDRFKIQEKPVLAERVSVWGGEQSLRIIIAEYADKFEMLMSDAYHRYGVVNLPCGEKVWRYHRYLGFYTSD